ncbi:hypothetical protein BaRGS_00012284 [Batillaria attramentaria]|uniref:Uncharacterized protein n=1 Tax=Batillaria attramentaria TaxID=370345 RepID=A0ABD0LB35_9CAEN
MFTGSDRLSRPSTVCPGVTFRHCTAIGKSTEDMKRTLLFKLHDLDASTVTGLLTRPGEERLLGQWEESSHPHSYSECLVLLMMIDSRPTTTPSPPSLPRFPQPSTAESVLVWFHYVPVHFPIPRSSVSARRCSAAARSAFCPKRFGQNLFFLHLHVVVLDTALISSGRLPQPLGARPVKTSRPLNCCPRERGRGEQATW